MATVPEVLYTTLLAEQITITPQQFKNLVKTARDLAPDNMATAIAWEYVLKLVGKPKNSLNACKVDGTMA